MSNMPGDKNILLNSDVYDAGLKQFQENLTDMLDLIKENGVPANCLE